MKMTRLSTMKRDNILVAFLSRHRGADNCVSSKAVSEYLAESGFPIQADAVNTLIRRVMFERVLPICSINGKGYFWAETQDEIRMAINELQGRICEINNRIELLNKFIFN